MSALEYTIDSEKVRDHLLEALDYIYTYAEFWQLTDQLYPSLSPDQMGPIKRAFSQLKGASADNYYSNIPQIEIPVSDKSLEQHNPSILIGGEIRSRDGVINHSSFSLCVTFSSNSSITPDNSISMNTDSCCLVHYGNTKRIIRRFHFDHQPYESQRPSTHLQYGGHFPDTDIDTTGMHYCLHNSLDNPRLPYFPMDFVLLLDLAIRDFETPLVSLVKESDWKSLVLKSQQIWWSDYLNWLNSKLITRDDCILHDVIYS